jgi:hypothetical protein
MMQFHNACEIGFCKREWRVQCLRIEAHDQGRIIGRSISHAARTAIVCWGEGGPLSPSGTPIAEVNTLMAELRESAAKRRAAEEPLQLALNAAHFLQMGEQRFGSLANVDGYRRTDRRPGR